MGNLYVGSGLLLPHHKQLSNRNDTTGYVKIGVGRMAKTVREDKIALDRTVKAAKTLLAADGARKAMKKHQKEIDAIGRQLAAGSTSGDTEPDDET